jgi:hypothetical protein
MLNVSVIHLDEREQAHGATSEAKDFDDSSRNGQMIAFDDVIEKNFKVTRTKRGEFIEVLCCLLPCILPIVALIIICYLIYVYAFNNGDWGIVGATFG